MPQIEFITQFMLGMTFIIILTLGSVIFIKSLLTAMMRESKDEHDRDRPNG